MEKEIICFTCLRYKSFPKYRTILLKTSYQKLEICNRRINPIKKIQCLQIYCALVDLNLRNTQYIGSVSLDIFASSFYHPH
jgi:hypothetical protein